MAAAVDAAVSENGFTAKDFWSKAMDKLLKAKLGQAADGALLAKILKKLK